MSCFNAIANCCPPPDPPPVECCVELSDIATLFPNGVTLVSGNTTFTFPAGGWYKEGCCLRNFTGQTNGGFTQQCTSDWSYQCSESIKCHTKVAKNVIAFTSFDPSQLPTPDLCGINSCPTILDGTTTSSSVTEKGERVVVSTFVPIWANITIGKYLRNCGYGIDVCTYHIGVSITYGLYVGGKTQGYKTWNMEINSVNTEVLNACSPNVTPAEFIERGRISETGGADNFPLCNYIGNEIPPGAPDTMVTVSRVKIATSLNCPITLSSDDNNPEVCNYLGIDEFCMSATQEQGPVSVTFNRTLPPVYVGKTFNTQGGALYCCRTRIINTFPNPDQMFESMGPGIYLSGMTWGIDDPLIGEQYLDTETNNGLFLNTPMICTRLAFPSCQGTFPDNTIFVFAIQCCELGIQLGPEALYRHHSSNQSDYLFNYSNVTGNTPIVHTYNIPSWTLNC